jgi:hypothetical protein
VWRIPVVNVEFAGREEIRAGIERLGEQLWDYLVQTAHPGTIQLDGDTASGRAYVLSFGQMRDGSSHLNYSVYHDRYQRTPDGWKFTERVDEIKYLDWPDSVTALRVPADDDDVPARLAELVDAATLRYLTSAQGSPVLLVHTATAPNAVLHTLPALPREVWQPSFAAVWGASAAIVAMYAPPGAAEAYERTGDPDTLAAALRAEQLIGH